MNRNIEIAGDKALHTFLQFAPKEFLDNEKIKKFQLRNGDYIHCVLWNMHFYITGTDIVKVLQYRFRCMGRQISSPKKFEEGVFSDLRNLKPGIDATLERPRSEFLEFLYKNGCIRTQKKQKVFFWYSVPHEALFCDALDRDVRRESSYLTYSKFINTYGPPGPMENIGFTQQQHMKRGHFNNRQSQTLKKKNSVNMATRNKTSPPFMGNEYSGQSQMKMPISNINQQPQNVPPILELNSSYLDYNAFSPTQPDPFVSFGPQGNFNFSYNDSGFCEDYAINALDYGSYLGSQGKEVEQKTYQMPEVFTPPKNEVVVTEEKNYMNPNRNFMPNIPNTSKGKPQK